MGAAAIGAPELAIDDKEAKMLSDAIMAVQAHYDYDVSEAAMLWMNLVGAVVMVYGPRAMAITARKSLEKKRAEEKKRMDSLNPLPGTVSDANS